MTIDPIVDQVRCARREYAAQFDFDLRALAEDLMKREQQHPERVVSLPPRRAEDKQLPQPSVSHIRRADKVAETAAKYPEKAPLKNS